MKYQRWNIFVLILSMTPELIHGSLRNPTVVRHKLPNGRKVERTEVGRKYEPTWESLDARPLPKWFDNAKVGIFIHFGVYSVPSFVSEWFWCYLDCPDRKMEKVAKFMRDNYPPNFTYQDFAKELRLEFFNATEWVHLFERSGAKYAVLTTKHHEGYTLWPSKYSFSWNSVDVGPNRDVVGEFTAAVRKSSLHLGLYHSLFEWFNPKYLYDKGNNFTTREYPTTKGTAELYELVNAYHPDLIWSDGAAGPVEYWNSTGFLAWLYNDSPVRDKVVVNDRWGTGTSCKHGGYFNCADRYIPDKGQSHKWENAMTLDKHSWGYRRDGKIEEYYTFKELLHTLAVTIANGGNLLIDVGPTKEGTIPVIMQERLVQLGDWLKVNGEAVYGTKAWISANDTTTSNVFYTSTKDDSAVYAIFTDWPEDNMIVLSQPEPSLGTSISLLGTKEQVDWQQISGYLQIILPNFAKMQHVKDAWVLKLTRLIN